MEIVKPIHIPVQADTVLPPDVHYNDNLTGVYFQTEDDLFGRITFYNLDALKICRGEMMPYEHESSVYERGAWVFKIDNSKWLAERFKYENEHYGNSYQFNGDVNEMLTDFNHYLFSFHDQFVEVIAKGFWFEKNMESLFGRELTPGHPFLPLPQEGAEILMAHNLTCQVRSNKQPMNEIAANAKFCPQKLFEFALELDSRASVNHTVTLVSRQGKLISQLNGYFGNSEIEFEGIATLAQVRPYIENYLLEVAGRRKKMGK